MVGRSRANSCGSVYVLLPEVTESFAEFHWLLFSRSAGSLLTHVCPFSARKRRYPTLETFLGSSSAWRFTICVSRWCAASSHLLAPALPAAGYNSLSVIPSHIYQVESLPVHRLRLSTLAKSRHRRLNFLDAWVFRCVRPTHPRSAARGILCFIVSRILSAETLCPWNRNFGN